MPKAKKTVKNIKELETKVDDSTATMAGVQFFAQYIKQKVDPITQEFGNGDMNVLRDKINEIIKANS